LKAEIQATKCIKFGFYRVEYAICFTIE